LTQNKEFLETKATCNRQKDKQKTLLAKESFALFLYSRFCRNPRRTTAAAEMNGGMKESKPQFLASSWGENNNNTATTSKL